MDRLKIKEEVRKRLERSKNCLLRYYTKGWSNFSEVLDITIEETIVELVREGKLEV